MNNVKLLLVDDNQLSMKLMKLIFDSEGYETFSAQDGALAMSILLREKIDLIITDILMPNVDGYYLCYKVRLNDQLKNIPIIVYSGTFTSQSEEKVAQEMGADVFIRKPAPKDVLIAAVKELLSNPKKTTTEITASPESFEAMHQYSSSLINKLEQRNALLEEAKLTLERTVEERTRELRNANEELHATNEELLAANEELTALNDQLSAATQKLNEALNKEKELVEMKSKFISIASHEFRTPLSTIALATGFIKKYNKQITSDDLNERLTNIEKQVSHMAYLLDDVLMIGKAEAGKIQVNLSKIKVEFFKKLAEEVVGSSGTHHKLHYSQDCEIASITTSEKLVRNIIINLITNAIKFSPGKKEISMNVICDKKNIFIVVKDHGMGIPAWDIKNLFTSFSRGSNVGTIEGTGLGLSIVKKAVDLLKGAITVKSKVGKGTEFTVILPL